MQTIQEPPYPLAARLSGTYQNHDSTNSPWIPPRPDFTNRPPSPFQQQQQQQQQQPYQQQFQQQHQQQHQQSTQQTSSSSVISVSSPMEQASSPYVFQKPASPSSASTSSPLALTPTTSQKTSNRKMTAGSSPLASSPLASVPDRPNKINLKPDMPITLPPESVCECFICHSVSPYSQQPPPEIPVNQRQELSRLAPTCPSIHLFCLASRIPMSLPLDANQKSPLTRSILDYFYSTWITNEKDTRVPRVQCLNFIPIHPLTASCFDRYVEGQSWNKRVCRPLWHAADLRCKLGIEGMYRNCMQDKCSSCFIFNDGFENTIAKSKYVYLSANSSRAHDQLATLRTSANGSKGDGDRGHENKVQCMILSFTALGRTYDMPPSHDKMKRPPKGWDVAHRQYEIRGGSNGSSSSASSISDTTTGDEYGVFAADAVVPLVMVLYKVT
ncbi:hypothetical protein EDD11_000044 [Mortierella claussenii]|nr:hypothetical protein EDD11_000044 [Mortierella claussenii]